ncbi:MAG: glutamate--tRNA ligase family protein [Phycisphaeraceae bacterium]
MPQTIVTRFAPSPTGALHVGGARTALYNWAFAKRHGGKFLLRLEDTDQARSSDAAADAMLKDLAWIGLDWDNANDVPRQSQRLHLYNAAIEKLLSAGKAYEDNGAIRFKIPAEPISFHDEVRGDVTIPAGQTEDFVIRKTDGFPTYHLAVVVDDADMGVTHVLRAQEHLSNTPKHILLQNALGLPRPTYAHFGLILNQDGSKMSKRDKSKTAQQELRRWLDQGGNIEWFAEECVSRNDFIDMIGKSEDSAKKVSPQDIKEFLTKKSSEYSELDVKDIPERIAEVLGFTLPEIDVADFRESGYLPDTLCNYLALLGWNPGNDLEKFDNTFLAGNFSLDRVNKGDSKFDREKLASFNSDAINEMPVDELAIEFAERLFHAYGMPPNPGLKYLLTEKDYQLWDNAIHHVGVGEGQRLPTSPPPIASGAKKFDMEHCRLLAEIYRPRSKTLCDPVKLGKFFFDWNLYAPDQYDPKAVDKILKKNDNEGLKVLAQLQQTLNNVADADWNEQSIEAAVKLFAEANALGLGKVAQPLRVAVSGSTVSPGIGQTLTILGKQETLQRIANCLALCGQ